MFVLAHLSDLHMALKPRLRELADKRGLGFINWQRGLAYLTAKLPVESKGYDVQREYTCNFFKGSSIKRQEERAFRLAVEHDEAISARAMRRSSRLPDELKVLRLSCLPLATCSPRSMN
jgi:hypothetical protein